MSIDVKITGLQELQRVLENMPKDVAKKIIRSTLKEAGEEMRESMAAAAPKESGFLSQHFNVKLRISGDDIMGTAFIGPAGKMYYPKRGSKEIGVATGKHPHKGGLVPVASVARFLEFGTSRMAAHPFMRAVFEGHKDIALKHIIADLQAAIAKWTK